MFILYIIKNADKPRLGLMVTPSLFLAYGANKFQGGDIGGSKR